MQYRIGAWSKWLARVVEERQLEGNSTKCKKTVFQVQGEKGGYEGMG